MSLEIYARAVAKQSGRQISHFLGKGHFGEAYATSDNRVLKVTSDSCEVLAAMKLKGQELDHVVAIHDVRKVAEPYYVIEQDLLDHNSSADDLFWRLSEIADIAGYGLSELIEYHDIEDYTEDAELLSAFEQLWSAMSDIRRHGVYGTGVDLQSDNFSYDEGKIVVFDNRFCELSQKQASELLLEEYPELFVKQERRELDSELSM